MRRKTRRGREQRPPSVGSINRPILSIHALRGKSRTHAKLESRKSCKTCLQHWRLVGGTTLSEYRGRALSSQTGSDWVRERSRPAGPESTSTVGHT